MRETNLDSETSYVIYVSIWHDFNAEMHSHKGAHLVGGDISSMPCESKHYGQYRIPITLVGMH